nr:hypothetical transcript [Hymenolepis microstoma]
MLFIGYFFKTKHREDGYSVESSDFNTVAVNQQIVPVEMNIVNDLQSEAFKPVPPKKSQRYEKSKVFH